MNKQTKILTHLSLYFVNSSDPLKGFFTQKENGTSSAVWDFVITTRRALVKNRIHPEKLEFDSLEAFAEWAASMTFDGVYISYAEPRVEMSA